MTKINSSDLKLNTIEKIDSTRVAKAKENQGKNPNLKLEKANENEMVGVSIEGDDKNEKGLFAMMADLVADFFKKIFGGEEVSAEEATTEPVDDTPKLNEELATAVDDKLGDGFSDKLADVAKNINCDPEDLLTVLYSESSLDPDAKNPSGAIGIMQFMPSTLKELGYTTEDIENMSAIEQLDVVQQYFEKNNYYHKGEKLTAAQLYAMVLAPGRADGEVLYTQGKDGQAYAQNEGLDIDDNGTIAMTDLDKRMQNKNNEMQQTFVV